MSPRRKKRFQSAPKTLADLPKRHTFFLNPYTEYRFTKCPQCDTATKMRKRPFVIKIEPTVMLNFNMTTRYCPDCDLIIMHQDILEHYLVNICERQGFPEYIGNDYVVLGTLNRDIFHKTEKAHENIYEHLYVFKKEIDVEVIPAQWVLPTDNED